MSTTTTPAERVQRYRADYADRVYGIDTDALRQAYNAATGACLSNALDALSADATESLVWVNIAQLHSFRYRKAI